MPDKGSRFEKMNDLWNSRPQIEGLSLGESSAIYNGNYGNVISKIASMSENNRAEYLNKLEGAISNAIHAADEGVAEMSERPKEEYASSAENLKKFLEEARKLHPGF